MDVSHLLEYLYEVAVVTLHFLELHADCAFVELKNSHTDLCLHRYSLLVSSWVLLGQGELDLVLLVADNWVHSKSFSDELNEGCLQVFRTVIGIEFRVLLYVDISSEVLVQNFALMLHDVLFA